MIVSAPTNVNWFYEDIAEWIVRELTTQGLQAQLFSSTQLIQEETDDCKIVLIVNFLECHLSAQRYGLEEDFLEALRRFRHRILINYDSVRSHWFEKQIHFDPALITEIIDINMISQENEFSGAIPYFWAPETLDSTSKLSSSACTSARKLPWCVIGHAAAPRARLVDALMQSCGTDGFVYLPPLQPYGAKGGLNRNQLRRVLAASACAVWVSYHSYPYHEGLRAPHAVTAGAVPAKVDPIFATRFKEIPWVYDDVESFARRYHEVGAEAMWQEAIMFFETRPSLGVSLHAILGRL